jgi:hypothetical protein
MKIARKHILQTVEEAMDTGGHTERVFKKYTITVSHYYQGRVHSGVRIVWKKNK